METAVEEKRALDTADERQVATDEAVEALSGAQSNARQAVHRVQIQALQRVGSRAEAVQVLAEHRARAHEEQKARVHLVQKQVLQQI